MNDPGPAFSRREFLVGTTGVWISATLPRPLAAAQAAADAAPRTLDAAEWTAVEAITTRILPSDDTPGAREAGCVNFIDKALATEDANALPAYRAALRELDRLCRGRFQRGFADLEPADQDAVLTGLETGRVDGWNEPGARPEEFFQTVRMHTILGFLVDPRHGGNRDYAGWQTVGWPGPVHALGGSQPDQMLGKRPFVPIWERAAPKRDAG